MTLSTFKRCLYLNHFVNFDKINEVALISLSVQEAQAKKNDVYS